MPIYSYHCEQCQTEFTELRRCSEMDAPIDCRNAEVVKASVCFPDLPLAPEPQQLLPVASLRAVPSAEQAAERTGQSEEHSPKSEAGG